MTWSLRKVVRQYNNNKKKCILNDAYPFSDDLVQGMLSLQKLQNLATLQQQQQQQQRKQNHSPSLAMPSLVGLQGLAAGLSTATSLNSPLNLSVGSGSALHQGSGHHDGIDGNGAAAPVMAAACSQMPQLILASGQLVQGVQGAQLLIPTSQGKLFYVSHGDYFIRSTAGKSKRYWFFGIYIYIRWVVRLGVHWAQTSTCKAKQSLAKPSCKCDL